MLRFICLVSLFLLACPHLINGFDMLSCEGCRCENPGAMCFANMTEVNPNNDCDMTGSQVTSCGYGCPITGQCQGLSPIVLSTSCEDETWESATYLKTVSYTSQGDVFCLRIYNYRVRSNGVYVISYEVWNHSYVVSVADSSFESTISFKDPPEILFNASNQLDFGCGFLINGFPMPEICDDICIYNLAVNIGYLGPGFSNCSAIECGAGFDGIIRCSQTNATAINLCIQTMSIIRTSVSLYNHFGNKYKLIIGICVPGAFILMIVFVLFYRHHAKQQDQYIQIN